MKRHDFAIFLTIAALAAPTICHAQSDAERLLSKVRDQVVALRVFGDPAPVAQFPAGEPPIWGTGFVVGPLSSDITGKQRIVTAAHVVQPDNMWARKGTGPARTVYPWVIGQAGRSQVEGFRGVVVHATSDIAQVNGPRGLRPVIIRPVAPSTSERYFVVSWGLDDTWGEPTEEPYIKEVKVVAPTAGDPPMDAGLTLVEIVPGQSDAFFRQSESGSPIFDAAGQAVAIMIKERIDPATGVAKRGIALPFVTVSGWLDGVRQSPVNEPFLVAFKEIADVDRRKTLLTRVAGGCVFLGKYTARNLEPNSERALADAPVGISYLKKVVGYFPEEAPESVSDNDAVLIRQMKEPELLSIPPRGGVNIRAQCPEVVPKPKRANERERRAYYGPVVASADSRFQIRIGQVQRQAYLDDFFYWGVVESVSEPAR